MKILTAEQMREVDRRTVELGIPNSILMENAGHRVVEFLVERFGPVSRQDIVILCGKGNNGGDGLVAARQLLTRFHLRSLHVVVTSPDDDSEALRMLRACGGSITTEITPEMRTATLVLDALLGTGLTGPARGTALEFIRAINNDFRNSKVLAVDLPSGMMSDSGESAGEVARADACITFTAPKLCHALAPNCERIGEWRAAQIGSPSSLMDEVKLHLNGPEYFQDLLKPRRTETNKGSFGHVLVVGGAHGKFGAAEMAGLAALRAGAGLVTVASSADRLGTLELMTASLPPDIESLKSAAERKNVIALGPGLGSEPALVELTRHAAEQCEQPMVIDADGLNALAGHRWSANGKTRILTPHPGEMSRLAGIPVEQVQSDRLRVAQSYATETHSVVVLKGNRTVIAFPDGQTYINPTGSPALATGGTGDILTGLIAGLVAQYERNIPAAVLCAVYLHGLAGGIGASELGDKSLIATDILHYLPEALRECAGVPHEV